MVKVEEDFQPIIRRSIILLIFRIVLTEILFGFPYILWRFFIDINLLNVSDQTLLYINSFSVFIYFFLITIIQTSIIIYIFLNWVNNYYEIRSEEIIINTGIFTKQQMAYPFRDIQSIKLNQGILDRLFNYGTVSVYIPTLGYDLHFNEITSPQTFIKMIKDRSSNNKEEKYLFKR